VIASIVKYHDMNQATLIEQIQEAKKTLEKLLVLLQSGPVERDRFVSHFTSPGGTIGEPAKLLVKSGKQIERCVIASYRIA
jgi:hypothetical protein